MDLWLYWMTSFLSSGVAFEFGPDITANFCNVNNIEYIIRSHEVKPEGYEVNHNGKCITVFSAPNYCDTIGNLGALINFTGKDLTPKYVTFAAVVRALDYDTFLVQFMCAEKNSFLCQSADWSIDWLIGYRKIDWFYWCSVRLIDWLGGWAISYLLKNNFHQ